MSHASPTKVSVLNTTPHFVHFLELAAFNPLTVSTLRPLCNRFAGKSEGASFKSFNDHREAWRVGVAMHRPLA
ncbi:MAG: hypothetical protein VX382_02340, partial [Candidatus Thermoplasmatota archaeon]|nr:hypothetical protein [Candidatus Thermoplasmatota archaeon]